MLDSASLIELALDLTQSLTSHDRFARLLNTVRHTISCDAVVLLQVQGEQLKPLAQQGLSPDLLGRRFAIKQHPRFALICQSHEPVRFSANSELPDPYDGMLLAHDGNLPVHACMGLPLLADQQLIGLLTLDSMTPNVFDEIPKRSLDIIAAMAAAALNTALLLQQLESHSRHHHNLVQELTQEALVKDGGELIGESAVMLKLKREIDLVAPSDFAILIEGETGVGKELVARTLHRQSTRREGPLVYVNCAALPENLIESELFGHVKGAFTGAAHKRAGKFSLADGGTLFLDEIGELPLAVQSKLLRVLQNKEIQPVGQDNIEYVDVRILAATNRELQQEVLQGRFRADLYHRLSVYPMRIPALRERAGDISLLAGYFSEQLRRKLGMQQLILENDVLNALNTYPWPGNVRELEHVLSRAALRAKATSPSPIIRIHLSHLEHLAVDASVATSVLTPTQAMATDYPLKQATDDFQRQLLQRILTEEAGNWASSARRLGVDRANLNRLAKRLGIRLTKQIQI